MSVPDNLLEELRLIQADVAAAAGAPKSPTTQPK